MRASAILDPALEQQDPAARRAYLSARLREIVAHAHARAPHFRRTFEKVGISPRDVESIDDLTKIPITRKDDVPALQANDPPFGGLLGVEPALLQRIFASPGPILDPQGAGEDFWRFRMALGAAGFRRGDIVINSSSYHLTPLGFMLDNAARSLGCVVVPAGVGQTDLQVRVAAAVRATAYLGTPSFLYTLLKRGRELGSPLGIEVAFVTAEMLPESLRSEVENDFGVRLLQGYGTADLGLLAYECPEKGGMHLHPEAIVEVLDLESGKPAAPGQPGEIVATIFDPAYPLIRFATGDIGALAAPSPCACLRTAPKLAGLVGRVGDAVKVKGMFIRGAEIEKALKTFPVARFQAVVTRDQHQDHLEYVLELAEGTSADDALFSRISETLREAVKVRGDVRAVPPGTIPQGAKRIDDRRTWR
ncbi:MAG TPA: AMP-binding protein [Myxococcales bacterium]|jgi:phenylacetate-CoA ligase|nr:AMP-binding protein [Myxococcales bacterium]